jgi:AmmeMemoRadiSam system protein B
MTANERDLQVHEIARLNSGDTAGDRARVVGYGAYAIH